MARPWRIELPGGRYHVTPRGNERREVFRDERDRQHFLDLLAILPERFGVALHAYVLMSLRQLGGLAGGLDYAAVAVALRRFPQRVAQDAALARAVRTMEFELSNV